MEQSEIRNLLPIKQKNGKWIFPIEKVSTASDIIKKTDEYASELSDSDVKNSFKSKSTLSLVEKYAKERKRLNAVKIKIAMLCNSLTSNPVDHIRHLKELIIMLQKPNTKMIVSEKKIISLSLLHVFNDILPGYKIRNIQEDDLKVKLKKDTRALLTHELSLLRYYKKYIDLLQTMVNDTKFKRQKNLTPARKKALLEIGVAAVRCLCELLVNRYYFNYHKTIISIVVPLVANKNPCISNLAYTAIVKLYKTDKLGEASLESVKQTVKVVKERNFQVPNELLRTFLSLNLQEVKLSEKKDKKDMKKVRKKLDAMSRKEKKYNKKMRALEQQLHETEAHENREAKSKLQTETLKKVFWIYFHVLKDDKKMDVLTPVLEGLSAFAHLINLEFFDDLSSVLCCLMEKETLGNAEKLHCMHTMFVILSGQAESLNIDPQRLYSHFYQILLNFNHLTSLEEYQAALQCFELMFIKRKKKITFNRILAFIKRFCTISLQTPSHFTLALLCAIRMLMMYTKNSDILLDTENIGSGTFMPEMEDPEYCNASSTIMWELHFLMRHSNPIVSDYAKHILHGCPIQGKLRLPDWLSKLKPDMILSTFSENVSENNFDFKKYGNPAKKAHSKKNYIFNIVNPEDSDFIITENDVKRINFLRTVN